jgi:hypothetical protein
MNSIQFNLIFIYLTVRETQTPEDGISLCLTRSQNVVNEDIIENRRASARHGEYKTL